MNCWQHKHHRAAASYINAIRLNPPPPTHPPYTFGVLHSDKDMDQVDVGGTSIFFPALAAWLALITEPFLFFFSNSEFLSSSRGCAMEPSLVRQAPRRPCPLTEPQPDTSSTPFQDVGQLARSQTHTHTHTRALTWLLHTSFNTQMQGFIGVFPSLNPENKDVHLDCKSRCYHFCSQMLLTWRNSH